MVGSTSFRHELMDGTRLSRRSLIGRAAALGGGALAANALAWRATLAAPATGQIIKAATMSELTTLHAFTARFTSALAVIYHVNEGLTKFAPDFSIVPGLATKWTVSPDQLTFTFDLRQGVTWHDGKPLTTKDVLFTLQAAAASDSKSPAQPTMKTYVKSVAAPDDKTIVITLTQPYSPLLAVLAQQLNILPLHLLKGDVYNNNFTLKPVGTGPYRVTDRQTSFITVEANPSYWGDAPYTKTIILKDAPDTAAQQAGLMAGELDVVNYTPTTMKPLTSQGFKVYQGVAGSVHGLDMDLQNPILQDIKVRQALLMSLDRQRIHDVEYTDGVLTNSVVSPAYGQYHDTTLAPISADAKGAGALLDAAGWTMGSSGVREKNGQKLALTFQAWAQQSWEDIGAITQASWKTIGVDLKVEQVELARLTDILSGRYDVAPNGWPLTADPIVGLTTLFHSTTKTIKDGGTENVFHYTNADVDKALADAYATTDVAKRVAFCHQVQQQIRTDLPFLPIVHPVYELMCKSNIALDETGKGGLSSVGYAFFMNRWRVQS